MKVARQDFQSAVTGHRPAQKRTSATIRSIFQSLSKPLGLVAICALAFNMPLAQAQDVAEDTSISQPSLDVDNPTPADDSDLPSELANLLNDSTEAPAAPESTDQPSGAPGANAAPTFAERAARPRAVNPGVVIDASEPRLAMVKTWDGGFGYNGNAPARFKDAHIHFSFGFWDGTWIKAWDEPSGTTNFGLEIGTPGSPYYINTDDRIVWTATKESCPFTAAYGTCTVFQRHDPSKKVIFTFDGNRGNYWPGGFTVTTEGFEDAIVEPLETVKVRFRLDTDKFVDRAEDLTNVADASDFTFEEVERFPAAPTSAPGRLAQAYLVRGKPATAPSVLYHTALDGSGLVEIGSDQHWVYNALAYDDITHQLVAISQKPAPGWEQLYPPGHLLSIDPKTAKVTDRGEIEGFKDKDVNGGINTGTMTLDGDYWVANASASGTGTLYAVGLGEGRPAVARTVSLYPGEGYDYYTARPNANDYTYALGGKGKYAFGMVNQIRRGRPSDPQVTTPTLERITLDGPEKGRVDWYDLSNLSTPAGNKMPEGFGAIYGSAWTEPNGNLVFATNRKTAPFSTAAAYQLSIANPDNPGAPNSIRLVSASTIPTSENNDATSYRPELNPDLSVAKTMHPDAVLISDNGEKSYLWDITVKNEEPLDGGSPSSGFIMTDALPVIKGKQPWEGYYSPFKNVRIVDGRALEKLRQELVIKYDGDELAVSKAIKDELKKVPLDPKLDPTTPDPAVDPATGLLIPGMTPRHITCELGMKDHWEHPEVQSPGFTCNGGPLEPQETKYVVVVADLVSKEDVPEISEPSCGPNSVVVDGLDEDPNWHNDSSTALCPAEDIALMKVPAKDQDPVAPGDQTTATVYSEDGKAKAKVYYQILIKNNGDRDVPPTSNIVDSLRLPAGVTVESTSAYLDGSKEPLAAQFDLTTRSLSIPPSQVGVIPAKGTKTINLEVVVALEDAALSGPNLKKLECASPTPENLDNPSGALNAVRMAGEHDVPLGEKNNQACVSIVNPSAAISKSPAPGDPVELNSDGEASLTYTITVRNTSAPGGQAVTIPSVMENVELPPSLEANGNISIDAPRTPGVQIGELAPLFPAAQWVAGNKLTVAKNVKLEAGTAQKILITVPVKLKANASAEDRRALGECVRGADQKFSGGVPNSVSMDTADADGEENNQACIPLIPAQPLPIFLEKVAYDATNGITSQSLHGAEFRIEPANATGASIVPTADASGRFTATLKPGSYYLVETKAPDGGYELLPDKVPFKLVKDANGARLEFAEGYSSPLISFVSATGTLPANGAVLGIQIADVQTGELPLTGPSHPLLWISFSALFALAILLFNLSDIRRVRRNS